MSEHLTPTGLLMSIEVHEDEPHLRLSAFAGPRIISTPREAIDYGFQLMDLRLNPAFPRAPADIQTRWESDTDDFLNAFEVGAYDIGITDLEMDILKDIAHALRIQRDREKSIYKRLGKHTAISVWTRAGLEAMRYLNIVA